MSLLDRLKRKPATSPALSDSGRNHIGGFLALEELNHALQGTQGLEIYDTMYRTDPDIHRSARVCINPILAADFSVNPAGGKDADDQARQVAEDLAWALAIGDDSENNAEVRTPLNAHFAETLPVLIRSGFCPSEVTWTATKRDGRDLLIPRKFGLRLPRTIQRWPQDDDGDLTAIQQFTLRKGWVTIPREDLLYYRVGAEGDNWEGVSMLRPCYKPWFIKDKIERLDAIAQEREAVGLPVVFPPSNAVDAGVLNKLEEDLAALRAGELAYLIMPGPDAQHPDANGIGWTFRIEGLAGSEGGRDPHPSLMYYKDAIAAAFVEEFLRLGQGKTGARATSDTQKEPFVQACQALAELPLQEINSTLVPRFVAVNYGPDVALPKITCSLSEAALSDLRDYVSTLATAGAIHADDDLEDHLRRKGDLPAADPEARKLRKEQEQKAQEAEIKQTEMAGQHPPEPPLRPGDKGTDKKTTVAGPEGKTTTTERVRHLEAIAGQLPHLRAALTALCPEGVEGCEGRCQTETHA